MTLLAPDEAPAPGRPSAALPARGGGRATAVRVVRALGMREMRLLLRHPAFLAGVALTILLLWKLTGASYGWRADSIGIVLFFVPLGWLTLVAANLGALRVRRHGVQELFDALPSTPATRTAGVLLAPLVAGPVSVVLLAGWAARHAAAFGPSGDPLFLEMAVALAIVVGGGVVGVAVARWLPRALFAVPAIFATAALATSMTQSATAPSRWLSFWVEEGIAGLSALDPRPAGWHLLWVTAWVAIMGLVAIGRHGLTRPVALAGGAAFAVAAVAGWAQTRPLGDTRAEDLANLLTEPGRHQVCEEVPGITACAYPEFQHVLGEWLRVGEGVRTVLPAAALRPLEMRQRPGTVVGNRDCGDTPYLETLAPAVRRHITAERLWPADGVVHPPLSGAETLPCSDEDLAWVFTAVQTGSWAVGLPPAPWHEDVRCAASHQSRAVLALWLGAQAVPDGGRLLRKALGMAPFAADGTVDFTAGRGTLDQGAWSDHPQWGVRFHGADIDAALALLERPPDGVRSVVTAHWGELIDAATPSSRLLALAGVPHDRSTIPTGDCPAGS